MKAILTKAAVIFFIIMSVISMVSNAFLMFVAHKLATAHGLFAKLAVVNEYNVFEYLNASTYSFLFTIILLGIFIAHFIQEFITNCKK
jgi:hypothetical protein